MRIIGCLLVLLGALALGSQEFSLPGRADAGDAGAARAPDGRKTVTVPPAVAGIAVVSGLLVLTTSGRRESA